MIKIQRYLGCILLPTLSALSCFAGQWESAVLEVQAKPMEPVAEVVFRYAHDTSGLDKMPEFGVLPEGVKLLPDTVSPTPLLASKGAQKENTDVFRFQIPVGCLSGERVILLPLGDTAGPKELKVVLKVPEWVEITPRRLIWKKGEAVDSKTTSVVSVTREGVVLTKVESSDDTFGVILERQAAQLYTVKVTPKDITKPKHAVIRVIGTDIHGQETRFNLYAEIR